MTIRSLIFALIALMGFVALVAAMGSRDGSHARSVSMVKLIANPEGFHGKKVITEGYFVYGSENFALYLSELDQKNFSGMNRIRWSSEDARVSDSLFRQSHCRFVMIWGTFSAWPAEASVFQRLFGNASIEHAELHHIENILPKSEPGTACDRDPMK